jgi:hypothetical protein
MPSLVRMAWAQMVRGQTVRIRIDEPQGEGEEPEDAEAGPLRGAEAAADRSKFGPAGVLLEPWEAP